MPNIDPMQVINHYAYELAEPLVPKDKLHLFEQQFGKEAPSIPPLPLDRKKIDAEPNFKATASRLPILQRLQELLHLRELRQTKAKNEAQAFGGLGGIILEGDSSVGKTVMVNALLRAEGYQEEKNLNTDTQLGKPYYQMNVAMPLADKEKLLVKAFYEGAVVVIDEINTTPMMERLLNDLLMGKLPEKYKIPDKAIRPGFMIIGTQNPVSLAGRRVQSTALSRRLLKLEVPNFSKAELLDVLISRQERACGAPILEEFDLIIDAFLRKAAEAKSHYYTPGPTMRQVIDSAELVMRRYQKPADYDKFSGSGFSIFKNINVLHDGQLAAQNYGI
jgi:MoxR-like ATPase